MKLLADLHTHSKNSRFGHGKNTIEEMAIAANEIGLVEIGITDHGYAHFFRTSKQKLKRARQIVDEINEWSKTKVLLGVEADIISEDGTLDIDNDSLALLDILIVGYHKLIPTDFANFFGKTKKTAVAIKRCTNAFINAINRYPVTIISHLDSILTTNLYEIGKACYENNVLIEINNRHTKWNEKQMNELIDSGCMFVLSSDAHSREHVGDVDKAMEFITKYNIPSERIANVEFEENEKSEADKMYTVYKSVYEQLDSTKQKRQNEAEINANREISSNLSAEMEGELKKIAQEQGLHYQTPSRMIRETDDDKFFNDTIAGSASEYIKEDKFNNIREENNTIDVDDVQYSFEDDHPLLKDSFTDKFQALNSVIKQSEEGGLDKISDEEIDSLNLKSNHLESSQPAYQQLNSSSFNKSDMDNIKNLMAGSNPRMTIKKNDEQVGSSGAAFVQEQKMEPENIMQSISRAKPQLEKSSPQETSEQDKRQRKPAMKRGGRSGGAFVMIDNLIDDDKK